MSTIRETNKLTNPHPVLLALNQWSERNKFIRAPNDDQLEAVIDMITNPGQYFAAGQYPITDEEQFSLFCSVAETIIDDLTDPDGIIEVLTQESADQNCLPVIRAELLEITDPDGNSRIRPVIYVNRKKMQDAIRQMPIGKNNKLKEPLATILKNCADVIIELDEAINETPIDSLISRREFDHLSHPELLEASDYLYPPDMSQQAVHLQFIIDYLNDALTDPRATRRSISRMINHEFSNEEWLNYLERGRVVLQHLLNYGNLEIGVWYFGNQDLGNEYLDVRIMKGQFDSPQGPVILTQVAILINTDFPIEAHKDPKFQKLMRANSLIAANNAIFFLNELKEGQKDRAYRIMSPSELDGISKELGDTSLEFFEPYEIYPPAPENPSDSND